MKVKEEDELGNVAGDKEDGAGFLVPFTHTHWTCASGASLFRDVSASSLSFLTHMFLSVASQ